MGHLNFAIVYPAKAAKHRADSRSNALFLMAQDDLFLSHRRPVGRRRDHTRSCRRNIGIKRQQVLNRLVISRESQERFIAVNFPRMVSIGGSGGTD
ncbi:hypothetical protein CBI33_27995 [Rhodococcus erythropolis]|nr:hypothetical protein CBI33_27995 [Rhodococcus erythropolis]